MPQVVIRPSPYEAAFNDRVPGLDGALQFARSLWEAPQIRAQQEDARDQRLWERGMAERRLALQERPSETSQRGPSLAEKIKAHRLALDLFPNPKPYGADFEPRTPEEMTELQATTSANRQTWLSQFGLGDPAYQFDPTKAPPEPEPQAPSLWDRMTEMGRSATRYVADTARDTDVPTSGGSPMPAGASIPSVEALRGGPGGGAAATRPRLAPVPADFFRDPAGGAVAPPSGGSAQPTRLREDYPDTPNLWQTITGQAPGGLSPREQAQQDILGDQKRIAVPLIQQGVEPVKAYQAGRILYQLPGLAESIPPGYWNILLGDLSQERENLEDLIVQSYPPDAAAALLKALVAERGE